MYTINLIKKEIADALKEDVSLVVPPPHIKADFSFSTGDPEKTKEIIEKVSEKNFDFIEKFEEVGPFVNIHLKKGKVFGETMESVANKAQDYGKSDLGKGKKILIEYSSPNIAKPIGVGHLRSTSLGESLARIYEYTDHEVVRENFLGDWGTQFGQMVLAYKKWGDDEKIKENPLKELKNLYVRFQEEAEEDETLRDEARSVFQKLEQGEKDTVELWERFRKISIEEFKRIYNILGINYDNFNGESFYVEKANNLIEKILKKEICYESDEGAVVVEPEDLPSFLLRKKDGSTLYITRDLAALSDRIKESKPEKILYVVGSEQNLHFKQLFFTAEKVGVIKKGEAEHISFGPILIDGKPMSTRGGSLVELEKLLNESAKKVEDIIKEKKPEIKGEELKNVSEVVGVGSVVYSILRQSRQKDINFDWNKALNFEGESSAYLQYTHVRIHSIINKINKTTTDEYTPYKSDEFMFETDEEFNLAKKIMMFPEVIKNTAERNEPHLIAQYLEDLASDFNGFYSKVSIKNTKDKRLKMSRLSLIKSVSIIIKRGLYLLGVNVPKRM